MAIERDGTTRKLFKVIFGGDGSYFVTVPYHREHRALLVKQLINYAEGPLVVDLADAQDIGVVDNDDARIKLAHHVSGSLQFSGQGVVSGIDSNGAPRGVSTHSWPLTQPVSGPSFGVSIKGAEHFDQLTSRGSNTIVFSADDLDPGPNDNGLIIEGYYFGPAARKFLARDWQGRRVMRLVHPSRLILELPVCVTDPGCKWPGVVGLRIESSRVDTPTESGFFLSSATGEASRNDQGELLAYGLFAFFPPAIGGGVTHARPLDYRPEEPPYKIDP